MAKSLFDDAEPGQWEADDAASAPVSEGPILLDRSTLEAWAECPAQARLRGGTRDVAGRLAAVGDAVHGAFGEAVTQYIDALGDMGPGEIADALWESLRASRPDVQPEAIVAARASVYEWAKLLFKVHPHNILHYDGGVGDRCGQLAFDIGNCRVTSEIDFLYTGPSPDVLCEIDYKTGHAEWNAQDVAESFQFQTHAWLILSNYTEVEAVEVRVWNTRINRLTFRVPFPRKHLGQYHARIASAVALWQQWHAAPAEQVPTWPTLEKCGLCPVALRCPASPPEAESVYADPQGSVKLLAAWQAKVKALTAALAGVVAKTGRDIRTADGAAFGIGRPRRKTKPKAELYGCGEPDGDEG